MADKDSPNSSGDDCGTISSTTFTSSSSKVSELVHGSCIIPSNPFAIKTNVHTCSSSDATDEESRPLIAPSTLKLDDSDSPILQLPVSSVTSKVVLRPSRLAVQTEKPEAPNSQEMALKSDVENNSSVRDADSTNGEIKIGASTSQLFMSGISTSVANVFSPVTDSDSSSLRSGKKQDAAVGGGFVFGQKIHERALNYDSSDPEAALSPSKAHELTFEDAAQKKEEKEVEQHKHEEFKKSLSESAKEYESKQSKRKYDEISVITGEEEESNVLQINCKLFEFNKVSKNWQERGKGILRLNDQMCEGALQSRVVMRTQGNLRVVLNTKVWAGMTVHHPTEKTVRLSAIDAEGILVYLVMARPKDADLLFSALNWRVSTLKSGGESSNGIENEASVYESATFPPSGISPASGLYDFNASPSKKRRTQDPEDVDSGVEFIPGGGEVSSDSVKDATEEANVC